MVHDCARWSANPKLKKSEAVYCSVTVPYYDHLQGGWLLLQNCHLGLNFMDELLDTLASTEQIHESCRVWITTEVHPKFPISLLQVSHSMDGWGFERRLDTLGVHG